MAYKKGKIEIKGFSQTALMNMQRQTLLCACSMPLSIV